MHRFFASPDRFVEERVTLDHGETRHLRDTLRLGEGANVQIFDGCGREFACTVTSIKRSATELLIIRELEPESAESDLELTLAAVMLKGDKFDLVVQKAVELGVKKLVPLRSVRCDIKSRESVKRVERWRKIALEASKQSGRAVLMAVTEPVQLADFLRGPNSDQELLFFSERDGETLKDLKVENKLSAIVGPEGGWDDSEIAAARSSNAHIVTFGGRILRAETAAIALTAVLQNRFGDMK